ncbi:MAG: HD domain-containing protein, partial [Candidatus Paceibacterota bacterium]
EGGIFQFFHRLILTDLKPQLVLKIKEDGTRYKELNNWVYKQAESFFRPIGNDFCDRFRNFLINLPNPKDNINTNVLHAAHFYATKWEFNIIERANPNGYEISDIKKRLQDELEKNYNLDGVTHLALYSDLRNFIDLCGELRFQIRWGHLHRIPKTSVIGHMLIAAILTYFFSLEVKACEKRCINNFFSALFHDLPEVLTKDVINPVKRSIQGLDEIIKDYEKSEMEKIYKLIPKEWHAEMRSFTEDEFSSIVKINEETRTISSDEINKKYNEDIFCPRDGEIVKASDDLAAFLEAYIALDNGVKNNQFQEAKNFLREKYKGKTISDIKFSDIYADFD